MVICSLQHTTLHSTISVIHVVRHYICDTLYMYCKSLQYIAIHCDIIANALLLPLQKTCDIDYCASLVHGIGDLLNYCPTLYQLSIYGTRNSTD